MIRGMIQTGLCICLSPLVVALGLPPPVQAQKYDPNNLPRLPGAELLVAGYVPERYLLTTEDRTITLPDGLSEAFVSMSADGSIVGCVRPIPGSAPLDERRIISTYSVKDSRLTDYLEITGFWGSSAISPDGGKTAYVTGDSLPDSLGPHLSLRLLDFKTGKVQVISDPSGNVGEISWSPDGRRIAFDMDQPNYPGHWSPSEIRTIYVADVENGTISRIGIGLAPSWSPSGEWIAFVS
jgi:WD40 repeat protein